MVRSPAGHVPVLLDQLCADEVESAHRAATRAYEMAASAIDLRQVSREPTRTRSCRTLAGRELELDVAQARGSNAPRSASPHGTPLVLHTSMR